MTLLIKIENDVPIGHPLVEENFRQLFPSTSFPKFLTPDDVKHLGYGIYDFSNQPEAGMYQKVVEVAPRLSDTGIWRQAWEIVAMDADEIAEADAKVADQTRLKRNILLADTDWMALSDVTMSAEMAAYRQALRDITAQEGFPHSVNWPVKP